MSVTWFWRVFSFGCGFWAAGLIADEAVLAFTGIGVEAVAWLLYFGGVWRELES